MTILGLSKLYHYQKLRARQGKVAAENGKNAADVLCTKLSP
jgi:hypothetical protein